jgi:hypothetical protein
MPSLGVSSQRLRPSFKRLADGGEVAPATIDPPAPAVSIRKSVTPDYFAPNYAAQRSALAKKIGFGLREKPIAATPPQSPGWIEAATVPPVSADPIDAAAHNAAGVAASRAKTKRKVAVPPEATAKRKSGRARKATA